jgi:hypothetical protein
MRIPLVRLDGDESPISWWEELFAPIMLPLFFIFLLILAIVTIPVEFVYRRRQQRDDTQGEGNVWDCE